MKSYVRNRALAVFTFLMIIGFTPADSFAQASSADRDRGRTMLRTVKEEIKKNYYDPQYHGIDIETRFKAAEQKINEAESMGQIFGIIAQAALDLNDSHTYFMPPQRAARIDYGWQMQMIGSECYVVAIKPGSDAEAKGLKLGDRVLAVNGNEPARENLWKMSYLYYTLRPQPGLRVVVQSPGGPERQLDLMAKVTQTKRVRDLTGSDQGNDISDLIREAENEDRLNAHRYYEMKPDVFIWKMPQFDMSEGDVDSMMEKVRKHKALILDLRGNGGGYILTLQRLIGNLFDRDVKIGDMKRRKEIKPLLAKTRGDKAFKGKLVVLVDSKSGSASELLARVVQLEKRGTVIGDRTSGSVMVSKSHSQQLGVDVVSFYAVSVTDADVIMTDGKSLEHVGVTPDELLLPKATALAAELDVVLARAAELVGLELGAEQAGAMFPVEWRK